MRRPVDAAAGRDDAGHRRGRPLLDAVPAQRQDRQRGFPASGLDFRPLALALFVGDRTSRPPAHAASCGPPGAPTAPTAPTWRANAHRWPRRAARQRRHVGRTAQRAFNAGEVRSTRENAARLSRQSRGMGGRGPAHHRRPKHQGLQGRKSRSRTQDRLFQTKAGWIGRGGRHHGEARWCAIHPLPGAGQAASTALSTPPPSSSPDFSLILS